MIAFACAVFTSAFLVFQVQPVIARFILPWFGGAPAVWTTCMLFFQLGLLVGYGYAHLLATRVAARRQPLVHLALVLVSLVALPITPDVEAVSPDALPLLDILQLLLASVGLPFVLLSASAPLLQHWFAELHPTRSPFRLYALSNLGSLLALLSYPFLIEPTLGLVLQTRLWSGGYVVYGIVALASAWPLLRRSDAPQTSKRRRAGESGAWRDRAAWTAFAACGSVVLLAATNQMSQDIAVVPFLWVLPLGLYLITYVICFDHDRWYFRPVWLPLLAISLAALVVLLRQDYVADEMSLAYQIAIYSGAVFTCCMVCHGEMVRRRPAASDLTSFYLWVALGGALGGVLVNLVAPLVFDGYWELHLSLLATVVLAGIGVLRDALPRRSHRLAFAVPWTAGIGILAYFLYGHMAFQQQESLVNTRGFYGVLHVYEMGGERDKIRALYHGRIDHGRQSQVRGLQTAPITYYGPDSGVAHALRRHPAAREGAPISVGAVGLGVGTIARYGRPGDTYRFYEINPQIETLARAHFTYLAASRAAVEVVLGDGRIQLARELAAGDAARFDVLVLDAFSGDAVPVHLLTSEAADLYWQRLEPDGVLALHVTNIHVRLLDVARGMADHTGHTAVYVHDAGDGRLNSASDWVLITSNESFLADPYVLEARTEWPDDVGYARWTDDFSNLLESIVWNP